MFLVYRVVLQGQDGNGGVERELIDTFLTLEAAKFLVDNKKDVNGWVRYEVIEDSTYKKVYESEIKKPKEKTKPVDGYISYIELHGKRYGIKAVVVEAHPITCKKCGHTFELDGFGRGKCEYCGTNYTTHYYVEET